MKQRYIKPSFRPIKLKQRILTLGSQGKQENISFQEGVRGKFDAKGCSFDALEECDE